MFRAFLLCVLCASAVKSSADEGWTLVTADFKRTTVNLRAIDDNGATVLTYGQSEPTRIPFDRLLQLDRGAAVQQVRGAWTLHLASGDRIGGEGVAIANDALTWKSPAAGDLAIPLQQIRGIARAGEAINFDPERTEDAVFLANGDNVKGIITGLEAGKIMVKQGGGDAIPVDLSAAKAVHFAAAGKPENPKGRAFRVQLSDGSVITAPALAVADNKVTLKLGSQGDRTLEIVQVTLIEQLNGPVSWLSARAPAETIYQPMFDVAFPPQMDRNYKGDRLRFENREYARGIGVHAYCKLTYDLDGTFKAFRTQYALSDDANKGRVTVRILLDGKPVHVAKDFAAGKLSPVVLIELGDAKTLSIEAHPGGDVDSEDRTKWHIDTQARLNWIEPALLKAIPPREEPKPVVNPNPAKPATKPTTTQASTRPK